MDVKVVLWERAGDVGGGGGGAATRKRASLRKAPRYAGKARYWGGRHSAQV